MTGLSFGALIVSLHWICLASGDPESYNITFGINITDDALRFGDKKIIGGYTPTIGEYPFQVSIRSKLSYSFTHGHFCGGSLIAPDLVLTAAHCMYHFQTDLQNYYVTAGSIDLTKIVQARVVRSLHIHRNYNDSTQENDVAIIKVASPFTIDNVTVRVVGLQDRAVSQGTNCSVSGWGTTIEMQQSYPNILKAVYVPIWSLSPCQTNYYNKGEMVANEGMICAGFVEGRKDACYGDSGGPLVCGGKLTGVVSWGYKCAIADLPGIYTDVAYYMPWIEANSAMNYTTHNFSSINYLSLSLCFMILINISFF